MEQYNNQKNSTASVMVKRRKSEALDKEATLYLQVIFNRMVRQVKLSYKVYAREWDEEMGQVVIPSGLSVERQAYLLQVGTLLREDCSKLRGVIARLHVGGQSFTANDIVCAFKKDSTVVCWNAYLEEQIASSKAGKHDASTRHFVSLRNSFSSFLNGEDIPIRQIGEEQVVSYEAWLVTGRAPNTVSFYLRMLRTVWRRALSEGIIKSQPSPFNNVNTRIEKTEKKAVADKVIHKIEQLVDEKSPEEPLSENLSFAAQCFLFCYYTQGMAFVDLAHLTKANIQGDYLVYARHKTGEKLRVKLLPVMKAIIRKYQSNERDLLFPILTSPDASYREYENALRLYNGRLMQLGKKVGAKLSSYVPRHSWATHAKSKGAADELISQGMGHTSVETTRIYIDLKNDRKIDKLNECLIMGKGKIYKANQGVAL